MKKCSRCKERPAEWWGWLCDECELGNDRRTVIRVLWIVVPFLIYITIRDLSI